MLNLKDKNHLTEDEKRDLHMLRYDGYKRYAAVIPNSHYIIAEKKVVECEDINEAIACLKKAYDDSIKESPSLSSEIDDVGDKIKFQIYDNLTKEYIEISLSDINRFALISRILDKNAN